MKVLIADSMAPECIDILKEPAGLTVDVKTGMSPAELKKCIGAYAGIVIRSATKLTADILKKAAKLQVIGRAGTGLDNVDIAAATRAGIIVMNTPGGNTVSTAEHTFSMLLALSRNIPQAHGSLQAGKWDKKSFKGVEVYNKVLGVVGLGKIGREVAQRALGFGMKVLGFDPFITPDMAAKMKIKLVELDELVSQADYITVHTPLNDHTRHMISTKQFKMMKPEVRLLNCARGGIIDEKALYLALKKGRVAGAALDVFEKEPPRGNPLLALPNVVTTPHLGASTEEAQVNVAVAIAHQIRDALLNHTIRNAANAPSLDGEILKQLKPFLDLGEKIGELHAQLLEGHIQEVTMEYSGKVNDYDTTAVSIAVIKGLLYPSLKEEVNYINAKVLAQNRGIRIAETRLDQQEDFLSLIDVKVRSNQETRTIGGTVFGKNDYRVVRIDGYRLDTIPQGHMLFSTYKDAPGIIGRIGSILGNNRINITNMSWGIDNKVALMALNTSKPVPARVREKLAAETRFTWCKTVNL